MNEEHALEEIDFLLELCVSVGFHHTEGILNTVRLVL